MNDSCFLCARPSFAEGLSRTLDFAGTMNEYNRSMTPEQADYLAMLSDWQLIGMDLARVLDEEGAKLSSGIEVD